MSWIQENWLPLTVVGGLIGVSWYAGKKFEEQELFNADPSWNELMAMLKQQEQYEQHKKEQQIRRRNQRAKERRELKKHLKSQGLTEEEIKDYMKDLARERRYKVAETFEAFKYGENNKYWKMRKNAYLKNNKTINSYEEKDWEKIFKNGIAPQNDEEMVEWIKNRQLTDDNLKYGMSRANTLSRINAVLSSYFDERMYFRPYGAETFNADEGIWNNASKEQRLKWLKDAIPSIGDKYADYTWRELTPRLQEEMADESYGAETFEADSHNAFAICDRKKQHGIRNVFDNVKKMRKCKTTDNTNYYEIDYTYHTEMADGMNDANYKDKALLCDTCVETYKPFIGIAIPNKYDSNMTFVINDIKLIGGNEDYLKDEIQKKKSDFDDYVVLAMGRQGKKLHLGRVHTIDHLGNPVYWSCGVENKYGMAWQQMVREVPKAEMENITCKKCLKTINEKNDRIEQLENELETYDAESYGAETFAASQYPSLKLTENQESKLRWFEFAYEAHSMNEPIYIDEVLGDISPKIWTQATTVGLPFTIEKISRKSIMRNASKASDDENAKRMQKSTLSQLVKKGIFEVNESFENKEVPFTINVKLTPKAKKAVMDDIDDLRSLHAETFAAYVSKADTQRVRQLLKQEFPNLKFSVVKDGGRMSVSIMAGDIDFSDINDDVPRLKRYWERWGNPKPVFDGKLDINQYHLDGYNPKYTPLFEKIVSIMKGEDWYDDSDPQTDYFNTAYYIDLNIGKWNKPYEYKPTIKKGTRPTLEGLVYKQGYGDDALTGLKGAYDAETFEAPLARGKGRVGYQYEFCLNKEHSKAIREALKKEYPQLKIRVKKEDCKTMYAWVVSGNRDLNDENFDSLKNDIEQTMMDALRTFDDTEDEKITVWCYLGDWTKNQDYIQNAETFEAPRKKTDFSGLPVQYKTYRMNSAICITKPDESGDSLCGKAQYAQYCGTSGENEISCQKCKSLFTKMTDEEKEKVRNYATGTFMAETFEAVAVSKKEVKTPVEKVIQHERMMNELARNDLLTKLTYDLSLRRGGVRKATRRFKNAEYDSRLKKEFGDD